MQVALPIFCASMALPFGNKIRGTKLFIHEGISLISFAYSADRTYKGYELMQQVENMDADSEANGLFNLDNSEYGKYIKAMGEASNLYTAASASNLLEYKVFGKPVTISSNIATCGEEYISDKTNSLIYQVTGEQNLVTSVISGMVGNGFVNGVKLEIEDAGRLDIDPSVDYDVDFQNNSVIMDVDAKDVPVKSVGEGGTPTNTNQYCLSGEEHFEAYKEMFGAENVEWTSRDTLSSADRLRMQNWKFPPHDELYIKCKHVYQNDLYFNQATGNVNWPNYDGFVVESINYEILKEGTQFMRLGGPGGEFLGTTTDSFSKRSLPPFSVPSITSTPVKYYELLENAEFQTGDIAPWFGFQGGGKQFLAYKTDGTRYTVQELLDADIMKDITEQVEKGEIIVDSNIE